MTEVAIDLRSSHRVEADGTHTVMVTISGLPDIDAANRINTWMRDMVRENAHKIGRRDPNPPRPS